MRYPSTMWQAVFIKILNDYYLEAKKRNPSFSKRSFAKKIKVSSGSLSDILNGKIHISKSRALEILTLLGLPESELNLRLVQIKGNPSIARANIETTLYEAIIPWEIRAVITSFCLIPVPTPEALAKNLDLTSERIREIIANLLNLKILEKNSNGDIFRPENSIQTSDGPSIKEVQAMHQSNLELNKIALIELPAEDRDFRALTCTGNKTQFDIVKEEGKYFYNRVQEIMGKGPQTEIYQLSSQFFPINLKKDRK